MLKEGNVKELVQRLTQAAPAAKRPSIQIFEQMPGISDSWLEAVVAAFPAKVRSALVQRGTLIADAVRRMSELGTRVSLNRAEEMTEASYRRLAQKLREDYRYAYLPTVLAEAGLLPGYAFPGDPGSLSLALNPDVIFSSRLQAQREFCPGQTVYARGSRWLVKGLALHRPGSLGTGADRKNLCLWSAPCAVWHRVRKTIAADVRIHDGWQSNQFQMQGWLVLRFLGPEIHRNQHLCVRQIKEALEIESRATYVNSCCRF
ncbi:MAG: hypothetical protein DMG17_21300 [Acidobacteria bacterium]|nr:MAG: hypothetical protein DMG17_21300 [Acidobacteriota bacterium]